MACNSALYAANTTDQAVVIGGNISFGNTIRRFGKGIYMSNGNVVVAGAGYYDVDAMVTFETGAGTTTVTLFMDGVEIPGASATVTSIVDTIYSVTIPAIIRKTCNCESVISAVLTGAAGTVSNATITVEKI